jgi:DNA-binding response OmpR family regulator
MPRYRFLLSSGNMKILVAEQRETVRMLHPLLTNHAIEVAEDGLAARELLNAFQYDLLLLDAALPQIDGVSLCRQIRAQGIQTPILLLTESTSGYEKAIGLDAGADDEVVKPFDPVELMARIRALLRRSNWDGQPILSWGHLRLDPKSREVTYRSMPMILTPKEYALLELFLRHHRRVLSCGMILEHLWAYPETPGEEAVRTHIKGLRQKLKKVGAPGDLIETVYGIGYRLKLENSQCETSNLNRQFQMELNEKRRSPTSIHLWQEEACS